MGNQNKKVNQDGFFIKCMWAALVLIIIWFVYFMINNNPQPTDENEDTSVAEQVLSPADKENIANAIDIFTAKYPKDICKAGPGMLSVIQAPEESAEIKITCKTQKLVEYFEVKENDKLKSISWKTGEQTFEIKFNEPVTVMGYMTEDGYDIVVVKFSNHSTLSMGVKVLR